MSDKKLEDKVLLIGELGAMVAVVSGLDPSKITGILKVVFMNGTFREADFKYIVNNAPYFINIIAAQNNMTTTDVIRKQKSDDPLTIVEITYGLLTYERLIRSDYNRALQDGIDSMEGAKN